MDATSPILITGAIAALIPVLAAVHILVGRRIAAKDRRLELRWRGSIAQGLRAKILGSIKTQEEFCGFAREVGKILSETSIRDGQDRTKCYKFTPEELGFVENGGVLLFLFEFFLRWEEFLVSEYKPTEIPADSGNFRAMIYELSSEMTRLNINRKFLRYLKTGDGVADAVSRFEDAHINIHRRPAPPA